MPRTLRVEYFGAMYHGMSRGGRREDVFLDDVDRHDFLKTLAEACQKTGWQVHAYCLMRNHYHLVLETPIANVVAGMAWHLKPASGGELVRRRSLVRRGQSRTDAGARGGWSAKIMGASSAAA